MVGCGQHLERPLHHRGACMPQCVVHVGRLTTHVRAITSYRAAVGYTESHLFVMCDPLLREQINAKKN